MTPWIVDELTPVLVAEASDLEFLERREHILESVGVACHLVGTRHGSMDAPGHEER